MSIDQQQKSYSTFHQLQPNPDHHKTDQEPSRKLSELSTNINPGSINNSNTDSNIISNDNSEYSISKNHSIADDNNTSIGHTKKDTDHSSIDIAPVLLPDNQNNNNPETKLLDKEENMGAKSKPFVAILFDYVIVLLFGASYYILSEYMDEHKQCIPGEQSVGKNCGSITERTTPLLDYPYRLHPVPVSFPYIFGAVTWIGVILIGLFLIKPKYQMLKLIFVKIEMLWREVLTSVIVTQTAVGFIKKFVGRPRPNYENYKTADPSDAISSFPSGHASSSFCIHILLVYHVLGAIYWSYRNDQIICGADNVHSLFGAKLWQKTRHFNSFNVLLVICLLALPVWISCTRITDYYHNYSDVIGGALLGIMVSTIVFTVFHNELYPQIEAYNKSVREPLLSNMSDS